METARASGRQLPEVGQAGVVPQSLREGLGAFIADAVAPHPRAEARELVQLSPDLPPAGVPAGLYSTGRGLGSPSWSCALEMDPSTSPSVTCPGFPTQRET